MSMKYSYILDGKTDGIANYQGGFRWKSRQKGMQVLNRICLISHTDCEDASFGQLVIVSIQNEPPSLDFYGFAAFFPRPEHEQEHEMNYGARDT